MRVLVVSTKSPWPPIDGGRLVLLRTLECLSEAGHQVQLVAPMDPSRFALEEVQEALSSCCTPRLVPRRLPGRLLTVLRAAAWRVPLTVARHRCARVRREVDALLAETPVDVVHAEQLQALEQARVAERHGVPVVLRAHNVESELWRFGAAYRRRPTGDVYLAEAARLAAWERDAVRRLPATIALSGPDKQALENLTESAGRVHLVPAPFPARLPSGRQRLSGAPPVVLLASRGWRPNEDAVRRFAAAAWVRVRRTLPDARLHVFGIRGEHENGDGVHWHPPPQDSAAAFPEGAVVVVPSRHATGVPMKALEAWARGLPVVAVSGAARSLAAEPGRELLVADGAEEMAVALGALANRPDLEDRLVAGGRAALVSRHDPSVIADALAAVYAEVGSVRSVSQSETASSPRR